MGSKKKRNQHKKKRQEPKKTSKAWMIPATVTALLIGDYFINKQISQPVQTLRPITAFHEQPNFQILESFESPLSKAEIEELRDHVYKKYSNHTDVPIVNFEIEKSLRQSIGLFISPNKRDSVILKNSASAINDIIDYCNSDYISTLKFRLHIPASADEIVKEDAVLPFYFLDKMKSKRIIDIKLTYYNSRIASGVITQEIKQDGKLFTDTKLSIDSKGVVSYRSIGEYVLISMNDEWRLYSKPVVEALHHIMRVYTDRHTEQEIQTTLDVSKPLDQIFPEAKDIANRWIRQEEGLVHAIQASWLMDRREDYGLTEQKITEWFADFTSRSPYKLTPLIKSHIDSLGVEAVINMYVNNPEVLFQ